MNIRLKTRSEMNGSSITSSDKKNITLAVTYFFESKFVLANSSNELQIFKTAAKTAVKYVQEAVNHNGSYEVPEEEFDRLSQSLAQLSIFVETIEFESLHLLCVHRNSIWGNRKFSFYGTNYTDSINNIIKYINSYSFGTKKYTNSNQFTYHQNSIQIYNQLSQLNIFFHGSGDGQTKAERSHLIFSKLHDYISQHHNQLSYITNGPSSKRGCDFTHNIFEGLNNFILGIGFNNVSTITLCGHSRGACEAIALNNLIYSLIANQKNNPLNSIPNDLRNYLLADTRNAFSNTNWPILQQRLRLIKTIRVILVDPVSGPRGFSSSLILSNHKGFQLIDIIKGDNSLYTTNCYILKASIENRWYFSDFHMPDLSRDINSFIIKVEGVDHGKMVRYTDADKVNYGSNNAPPLISMLCGIDFNQLMQHYQIAQGIETNFAREGYNNNKTVRKNLSFIRENLT